LSHLSQVIDTETIATVAIADILFV